MVGINGGIPVPLCVFPFAVHNNSFFGDLHTLGTDGVRFYTESKCVTTTWFDEAQRKKKSSRYLRWNARKSLGTIELSLLKGLNLWKRELPWPWLTVMPI
jgi:hypothetical protein